jgi:hypothetical protein
MGWPVARSHHSRTVLSQLVSSRPSGSGTAVTRSVCPVRDAWEAITARSLSPISAAGGRSRGSWASRWASRAESAGGTEAIGGWTRSSGDGTRPVSIS